jgi:hypothetical protein
MLTAVVRPSRLATSKVDFGGYSMPVRMLFGLSLLAASMLRAQDSDAIEDSRVAVLTGRPQIEIHTIVGEDVQRDAGLTDTRVKDDTELILRRSGIPVVRECPWYEFSVENGKVIQ